MKSPGREEYVRIEKNSMMVNDKVGHYKEQCGHCCLKEFKNKSGVAAHQQLWQSRRGKLIN